MHLAAMQGVFLLQKVHPHITCGCGVRVRGSFEIHGASVADAPTARSGDFVIKKTIIHCTTSVGDLLINKCKANIDDGYRPVIITIFERVQTALSQIEDAGLEGRIEVWDIQQFLSSKKNKSTELRLIEIFKGNELQVGNGTIP